MQNPATVSTAPLGDARASTGTTRRRPTEDWMAVVLGFVVIAMVVTAFHWKVTDLRNIVPTFRWTTDAQIAALTPGWMDALDSITRQADAKGQPNVAPLSRSLKDALASKDRKAIEAAAGKMAALGSRTVAGALAAEIRGHAAAVAENRVFARDNLVKVLWIGLGFLIVATVGIALLGGRVVPFVIGLPVVFGLALIARLLAGMDCSSIGGSSTSYSRWAWGSSSATRSACRSGSSRRSRPNSSSRRAW